MAALEHTPIAKQMTIKAMLESGIPTREIADEVGVGLQTISSIRKRFPSNNQVVESLKKVLPASFYTMGALALANISPKKLEASSALQLATVSGICVDKARDMENLNRPVFNIVEMSINVTRAIEESKRRLEAIDAALISTQSDANAL